MIEAVNIRALKDKLSAYLRKVQDGHVVLVSDRGRVIAELRKPTVGQVHRDDVDARVQGLVEAGVLELGLPNAPDAYGPPLVRLSAARVDAALAQDREEP